jgi:hypothetical protein
MEIALTVVLGAIALAYICSPLWSGASASERSARMESWHTAEQLELDREMGKIDQAEYDELKPNVPVEAPAPTFSLEGLIMGARRHKRTELSIETEVMIARARAKKGNLN